MWSAPLSEPSREGHRSEWPSIERLAVPSDTSGTDTTGVDTTGADTSRVDRYLTPLYRQMPYARRAGHRPAILGPLGDSYRREVLFDTTNRRYRISERVGGRDVRIPYTVSLDTFQAMRLRETSDVGLRDLVAQRARQAEQRRSQGLVASIQIPGGRQSAFSTIFGKNEVSLRVTGTADVRAGFDYRTSPQMITFGRKYTLNPAFDQNLSLGVTGTIGDKLNVNVNWDTQNQFDYQNQLRIQYQGYEDEIVRLVEAGNVFLQTPATLIRGGQSLFGIKSEFQLGGLRLTTVASQEEGQATSLNFTGGSETQTFELRAVEYDDATHFFLASYFRNHFETALSQPTGPIQIRTVDDRGQSGVSKVLELEVWRLQTTNDIQNQQNQLTAVAVADLGEEKTVLSQTVAAPYGRVVTPDSTVDQYDDRANGETDQRIRAIANQGTLADYLSGKGLRRADYANGTFRRLVRGTDYTLDEGLGFVSLRQRLNDREALAVAFKLQLADGRIVQVGDFAGTSGSAGVGANDRALFLKLLRPAEPQVPAADVLPTTWPLEMRNIYSLRGRSLQETGFTLGVYYDPPGEAARNTLPLDGAGAATTLTTVTGLDRVGAGGSVGADNRFDFLNGRTIRVEEGLLIFPYLEPFGKRIVTFLNSPQVAQPDLAATLAFPDLYLKRKETARRESNYEVYRIRGEYQGSSQSFFDLRAYAGLVRGSVKVTSGGSQLAEDVDFRVDYTGGTVTIINPAYTSAGRNLQIDYEQNALFNLQKKTLLGLRADYTAFDERLQLGSTMMRLSQRSPLDKFRIGDEPVSNTIWGLDGRFRAEPRFLTRWADALPFYATRAPSRVNVTAEFAQLRPGNAQTLAFQETRSALSNIEGSAFGSDETNGVSYIDDFESFENNFSLRSPGAWAVSSAPDSVGTLRAARELSSWRAAAGWYTLNENICAQMPVPCQANRATAYYRRNEIFPTDGQATTSERTAYDVFDFYFDPRLRGPYNVTSQYAAFAAAPERTWGGMMTRLPEGYTDFELKNVEFVELVLRPHSDAPGGDAGPNAFLYLDLGRMSEDVIPDGRRNSEDGLELRAVSSGSFTDLARLPQGLQDNLVTISTSDKRTEDVGLDGLVSVSADDYPESIRETEFYTDFLAALRTQASASPLGTAEVTRAEEDPAADDFHSYLDGDYFNDEARWPGKATIQQRFLRFFPGTEFNSYDSRRQLGTGAASREGNSRTPDGEGLPNATSVNTDDAYFQYRIPLSPSALATLAQDPNAALSVRPILDGWYLVRVPVRNYTRRVGLQSDDFSSLPQMRMWTTGHSAPATLRFASIEIVGSQWQKAEDVAEELGGFVGTGRLSVEAVNTEEDASVYVPSPKTVRGRVREITGGAQRLARDQSIGLRVDRLEGDQQRAVFKTFNQGLDLLKYSNVRMEAHLHGIGPNGLPLDGSADRGRVRLFVRLGANETDDFYEIEQPLTPTNLAALTGSDAAAATIWRDEVNALNVQLSALNLLRTQRDQAGLSPARIVYHRRSDGTEDPRFSIDDAFGVPGMRLGIKGSPSLNRVTSIVIGLRADSLLNGPGDVLSDVVLWANELRVAGYDAAQGWSAIANADVALADLATVRGSFRHQTDGFGALNSTLGQRDQTATQGWNVQADFQLHRFLPSRFGWSLPISVQASQSLATPRYAPGRGDVRLEDLYTAIERRTTDTSGAPIAQETRDALMRTERLAAETYSSSRTVSMSVSKTGSRSAWIRNTLEGVRVSYSAQQGDSRSPSVATNDTWGWQTSASYTLPTQQPKTVRPLWFLGDAPLVGFLGGLRFNYLPSTVRFDLTANRQMGINRARRPVQTTGTAQPNLPELALYPFRDNHSFLHGRTFSFGYTPFTFLRTQFDSDVQQTASLVGADSVFIVVRRLADGTDETQTLSRDEAYAAVAANPTTTFLTRRLDAVPVTEALSRVFSGDDRFRTESYNQRFVLDLTPRLPRSWTWITLNNITASTQFAWQNAPIGLYTGANVANSLTLASGTTLRPQDLFRKIPAFRRLETWQRNDQQAVQRRNTRSDAYRTAMREYRTRVRERDRLVTQAQTDSTVTVPPLPTEPSRDTTRIERASLGKRVLRKMILGLASMSDFRINYTLGRSASASGVVEGNDSTRVAYSLLDAFRGAGVPMAFRFGLATRLPDENRFVSSSLRPGDVARISHRIDASTTLRPTPNFNVALSWKTNFEENENRNLSPGTDGFAVGRTGSGRIDGSSWAFGGSFEKLFNNQVTALRADFDPQAGTFADANGDGLALSPPQLERAFRETFARTPLTLGSRIATPFPMPTWRITYSGLHQLPLLRRLLSSATLSHAYTTDYAGSFDARQEGLPLNQQVLVGSTALTASYLPGPYEATTYNANSRFAPLVGVDLRFKNNLSANVAYNTSHLYALTTSTKSLTESRANELSVRADYRVDRLRLPFMSRRLSNALTVSLALSQTATNRRLFAVEKAVTAALVDGVVFADVLQDNKYTSVSEAGRRITFTPTIGYTFSNTVQARFNLTYERFDSDVSYQQPYTTMRGGFNVIVNLNSN